jgi:hypothetical protein
MPVSQNKRVFNIRARRPDTPYLCHAQFDVRCKSDVGSHANIQTLLKVYAKQIVKVQTKATSAAKSTQCLPRPPPKEKTGL